MSRINKHGVDIEAILPGDRIELEVLSVSGAGGSDWCVAPKIADSSIGPFVQSDAILSHTLAPRPIQAGDWVALSGSDYKWQVVEVHEDRAWIKNRGIGHAVRIISDLIRTTPPEGAV